MPSTQRSFGFSEDLVLEVPVAPEGLASRLRSRLGQKPKRVLGVIKISNEWVGRVEGSEFAVWERRKHAVRAHGRIRGQRGGSRVEARIALSPRSRNLMIGFFLLFATGAVGGLTAPEGLGLSPASLTVAFLAGLATLLIFWVGALRQRAELRAFLADVFRASP